MMPHPVHRQLQHTKLALLAALAVGVGAHGATANPPTTPPQSPPIEPPPAQVAPPATNAQADDWRIAGHYDQAIEAYRALALDEKHAVAANIGLAMCRLETGLYAEGSAGLVELNAEKSPRWHHLLARFYRRTGQYEDAMTHLREAIRLDGQQVGARRMLGDMLEELGQRDEAIEVYAWFQRQVLGRPEAPSDAAWLTDTGLGFLRYSVLTETNLVQRTKHVLNDMLQLAYARVDRTYWPARIAAGDLLREKYNNDGDDGSVSDYQGALKINANLCEAHVGLGAVALEVWDFDEAEKRAEAALSVNPRFAPALHLLARTRMRERQYGEAALVCERALAVNPNDLTALAIAAGSHACRFDPAGVEEMRARVMVIAPGGATFDWILADMLGGIRQYAASEQAYLKAIAHDPTNANARTELGMMYMQWGLEDKAREALEAAWRLDAFNARTKNTLDLLESLERFDRVETPHFIVLYDAAIDPGLGEYASSYLEDIYEPITSDFDMPLKEKTIIQLFPTSSAFGVRITGKPWIHTVGACTGRVIAMSSPRRSPDLLGPYNMARVLTHEFTHTVTLAATNNRIPHWLTEGLAVYQEDADTSFDWCEMLADAAREDRLFTLESIDWGFVRPQRPTDRPMAYAQSEWMCMYIVERFGYDSINAMIRRFRDGQRQGDVFVQQFGIEPEAFDSGFHQWAHDRLVGFGFDLTPVEEPDALRALAIVQPEDATIHGRLAQAEMGAQEQDLAIKAARRALALDENQPLALEVLSELLMAQSYETGVEGERRALEDEARPLLERLGKVSPDNWTAPKLLGTMALRRKEPDRAIEPLMRLQHLCPKDPASWRGLAGIYLDRGLEDKALPQLLELARMEEHDAEVPAKIARIEKRREKLGEARYWLRQALAIDPFNADFHTELAVLCMRMGDTQSALREYRMLTKLEPESPAHFEKAAVAAHKLGLIAESRSLASRAIALDPHSPARALLP